MTAPHMWLSTVVTVSASAISTLTWLNPTPPRLAVYAAAAPLPVAPATLATRRLATPYLGGSFPRWIALASPSARRHRRNPQVTDFGRFATTGRCGARAVCGLVRVARLNGA